MDYRRALLRTLYDECSDTGLTLTQAISALRKARVQSTHSGAIIRTTATNGHSIELETAQCTPADIAAIASQFEDIYTNARAALIAAGTASPTDEEIKDKMLLHRTLVPLGSHTRDFSRYGTAWRY